MATDGNLADLLFRAQLSSDSERFDDMASTMAAAARSFPGLNEDARNLFATAFKNAVGSRRASWRVLDAIERRTQGEEESTPGAETSLDKLSLIMERKAKIQSEIREKVEAVIELLDSMGKAHEA